MNNAEFGSAITKALKRVTVCERGIHNRTGQEIRKVLWQEGDNGLRYKWNKIGEVKCYEFTCKDCGHVQEFMSI